MNSFEKIQRFFNIFDEDIKRSRERVVIPEDIDQISVINKALVKNPGWRGYYNTQHSIVQKIKMEEDIVLSRIEAEHFVKYKENFEGTKAPSDKLVQAKIDSNVQIQKQKRTCNMINFYDKRFTSIVQSINKQLDALTVLSNNLRKEL